MPLNQTSGNATADSFGGGSAAVPNYIEEVFSTYLYTGNGSTQTITNNIDLSTKGGLVWIKSRSTRDNVLFDTVRGTSALESNTTDAQEASRGLTAYTTSGFSLNDPVAGDTNATSINFASWTFRKQPKFFDVVTYTGNGTNRTIAHSLGSAPGFIIVKCTSTTSNWTTYHRSLGAGYITYLNLTNASATSSNAWNNTAPTSTEFSVGGTSSLTNTNGATYVAYLFAHDAGGFGLTGTDNVISCGTFTSTGSVLSVNLGWEPQWLLYKESASTGDWKLIDNMRGFQVDRNGSTVQLNPNLSSAESALGLVGPTSTGFTFDNGGSGVAYIYIAIRRGPMKVPTDATKVFSPKAYAGTSSAQTQTTNFPVDLMIDSYRSAGGKLVIDRLRGSSASLETQSTAAEDSLANIGLDSNTGVKFLGSQLNSSGTNYIAWNFRRAPSFFDEVCYTGTGANRTVTHNLGVVPELMIIKSRSSADGWPVYSATLGAVKRLLLNNDASQDNEPTYFNSTSPTASVFTVGTDSAVNASGTTYVAYLFATCAGVSKVGTYTGTGATQTISCGFAGGARFVLIKRTNSTGDWWVWDTARGMVAGTDPRLALDLTNAENNQNWVYTTTGGFQIVTTDASVNASGGTYIFLAIA